MPATTLNRDFEQIYAAPTISRPSLIARLWGSGHELQSTATALVKQLKQNEHHRERLGTVVGAYRLTHLLGTGGTSAVFLAERADDQFSAQVAIKIFDGIGTSEHVSARWRIERQILATLNHPSIARMLDAGETADAKLYLVMEYVQGDPIDRYCDERSLNVSKRLELVEKICDAVTYAHNNLIIHCDLKPANIIVTAGGIPKLLDFGISRLLYHQQVRSLFASPHHAMLTPAYASPEQVLGRQVSTSSDVYSLGVMLYELLTGRPAHTVSPDASQLELERSICVVDPPPPSSLFVGESLSPDAREEIEHLAHVRGATPKQITGQLKGALDAIVLRAIRKEPHQRYSSVAQLGEELRRYRHGERLLVARDGLIIRTARMLRTALAARATRPLNEWTSHLPPESADRVRMLSQKHGISAAEILDRALRVYDSIELAGTNEEVMSLLESGHEQVMTSLKATDRELTDASRRLVDMNDPTLALAIRSQLEHWAAQPENSRALRNLGIGLTAAAGTT